MALESSQVDLLLGGPRPPRWWRRRPGKGHGADATLPCFVSSLVSNAENALTAKRTSGSDPVKMRPGVLFVAGFVSKEDFFFPSSSMEDTGKDQTSHQTALLCEPHRRRVPTPTAQSRGPGNQAGRLG